MFIEIIILFYIYMSVLVGGNDKRRQAQRRQAQRRQSQRRQSQRQSQRRQSQRRQSRGTTRRRMSRRYRGGEGADLAGIGS